MKKTLLLFITLLTVTITNAQAVDDTFTVDNINYIVTAVGATNTVSVAASASFPSTNLVIPATVSSGGNSFNVTAINNQSFRNNTDIQSVVIQAPITNIGNLTFSGCTNLQTVDISATSLTTLNIQLFDNCSSLTSVNLPSTATTTAASPFRGCTNLTTVNTENLTSIGNNAFLNCGALTSANFSELLTTGASALANTGFTSLSFPKLTGLGNLCLQNSPATQIDIPVVETIGTGAFNGCAALTSITFPSTLTSLNQTNYNMFTGCTSLTNVIIQYTTFIPLEYNPDTASANTSIFADVVANATLTIPSSVNAADYTGGDVWKDFNALTLNVDSKEAQLGWSFYPNPANDVVSIKNSQLKNANITVYDLNGRALLSKTVNSTQSEINISNLHTGIYLFNVKTDAGEFVKRIVKQ